MGLIQVVACRNSRSPARRLLSPEVVLTGIEVLLSILSSTATLEDMFELSEIVE